MLQAAIRKAWRRRWGLLGLNYKYRTDKQLPKSWYKCGMIWLGPSVYLRQVNDPGRMELGPARFPEGRACSLHCQPASEHRRLSLSISLQIYLLQSHGRTVTTPYPHFRDDDKRNYRHEPSEPSPGGFWSETLS